VAPALVEWPTPAITISWSTATVAAAGKAIPNDAQSLHFGGGQTEAAVQLAPGTHTLLLELGELPAYSAQPADSSRRRSPSPFNPEADHVTTVTGDGSIGKRPRRASAGVAQRLWFGSVGCIGPSPPAHPPMLVT